MLRSYEGDDDAAPYSESDEGSDEEDERGLGSIGSSDAAGNNEEVRDGGGGGGGGGGGDDDKYGDNSSGDDDGDGDEGSGGGDGDGDEASGGGDGDGDEASGGGVGIGDEASGDGDGDGGGDGDDTSGSGSGSGDEVEDEDEDADGDSDSDSGEEMMTPLDLAIAGRHLNVAQWLREDPVRAAAHPFSEVSAEYAAGVRKGCPHFSGCTRLALQCAHGTLRDSERGCLLWTYEELAWLRFDAALVRIRVLLHLCLLIRSCGSLTIAMLSVVVSCARGSAPACLLALLKSLRNGGGTNPKILVSQVLFAVEELDVPGGMDVTSLSQAR